MFLIKLTADIEFKLVNIQSNALTSLWSILEVRSKYIAFIGGSLIVSAWAMLRFYIKPSTLDLVGQQLLARQWIHGFHSGATVGPTNYILKMIFIYIPFSWLHLNPRLSLVIMTLLVDIATYVLLVLVLRSLYVELLHKKVSSVFYLCCLWLALMAGSMYWIQFSNSRNLEIVGGLFVVLLGFKYLKSGSLKLLVAIGLVSSLVLFADPLQLYMTVIPFLVFEAIDIVLNKSKQKDCIKWLYLLISLAAGFAGSKLLIYIAKKIWHVNLLALTTHRNNLSFAAATFHGIEPALKQMARLYVGGFEYGRIIEAFNLLFVAVILLVGLFYTLKKLLPKRLVVFFLSFWALDLIFYIVSGQALQFQTSRYLIMTLPIFFIFLAGILTIKNRYHRPLIIFTCLLVVINAAGLFSGVARNWDTSFSKDNYVSSITSFMKSNGYPYGYGSIDTSLPTDYYSNGQVKLLPLNCANGNLIPSLLFFDKAYYIHTSELKSELVPVILDGNLITNTPSVCTPESIEAELGNWQSASRLSDGSLVLIYPSSQLGSLK